jgi:hypothetical protein
VTVTVTNVEHRPDGSAWSFARVTVALAGPGFDANGAQIVGNGPPRQTDATGTVSFSGLIAGQTYVWTAPDKSTTYFTPTADGSSQTLASCAGPYIPAGSTGVTQAQLTAQLSTLVPGGSAGNIAASDAAALIYGMSLIGLT